MFEPEGVTSGGGEGGDDRAGAGQAVAYVGQQIRIGDHVALCQVRIGVIVEPTPAKIFSV
jgi:hypothetical protein